MGIRIIDINTAGINVISSENDAMKVTQLELDVHDQDIKRILGNRLDGSDYRFDKRVVYALSMGEESLLNNYIAICKNISNNIKRITNIDINEMPQIMYDLKGIKNSFENIKNEQSRRNEQISLYEDAKLTKEMFKHIGYRQKVTIRSGIKESAYIAIQRFLQKSQQPLMNTLGDGQGSKASVFRTELHKDEYTQDTNRVSANHNLNKTEEPSREADEKEEISL